jgi:cysteinyl-tRNA synthetase
MSKSAGPALTLQVLTDRGYDPLDYRYFLLGGHYRSQLQFSWEALDGARNARKSLGDRVRSLAEKAGGKAADTPGGKAAEYTEAFLQAMEDDLSSPRALAELRGLLKDNAADPVDALAAVLDMDRVLGLNLEAEINEKKEGQEDLDLVREIGQFIAERAAAKKARDFTKADAIRAALKERGIILEDGPAGTVWRRE